MEKGTLIEFRVQGERRLAVVERPEGKKDWIVIDEGGQHHKLRPQRIEYTIDGGPYKPADISSLIEGVQSYLDPSSLEVAWEILVEEGEAVTPKALSELLFSEQTPISCYAAHILLSQDKIYFKNKGETYEPRPTSIVEEIKHQLQIEQQRDREKEEFFAHLQEALAEKQVKWTQSDRDRLETLEKYVIQPEGNHKGAQEILSSLGRNQTPEAALELLIGLKWWNKHENLFLRRSSYPVNFPKKVLDLAQSCLNSSDRDRNDSRLDLTHLKVYTIDDESTEEIDDGLSVEYLEEGQPPRLWIHIADPTRLVVPGDELDLEARRRSTSLYLPTGMISMFPTELATGL